MTEDDVRPAVEALIAGVAPVEVETGLAAGLTARTVESPAATARAIVRAAGQHAAYWSAELESGAHPTLTVPFMVMHSLFWEMRGWVEDDADGRLDPIAATRSAVIATLIPNPGDRDGSTDAANRWEDFDGKRPDPVRAVRALQALGVKRSRSYTLLRRYGIQRDATDRDIPPGTMDAILRMLQAEARRRILDDQLTAPGRKRRSAYRMRQRRPDLQLRDVRPPRRVRRLTA